MYTLEPVEHSQGIRIYALEKLLSRETNMLLSWLILGDYVEVIRPTGQDSYIGRLIQVVMHRGCTKAQDALAIIHDGQRKRYDRVSHLRPLQQLHEGV